MAWLNILELNHDIEVCEEDLDKVGYTETIKYSLSIFMRDNSSLKFLRFLLV